MNMSGVATARLAAAAERVGLVFVLSLVNRSVHLIM